MKHILIILALILGNYQGYVALMENGRPVEVYQRQVQMLPAADQKELAAGIEITSPSQLENLLQDYLS